MSFARNAWITQKKCIEMEATNSEKNVHKIEKEKCETTSFSTWYRRNEMPDSKVMHTQQGL